MGKQTLAVLLGAVIALVLLLIWNDRIVAIMLEAIRANNQAQLLIMSSLNNVVVPFLCATPPAIAVLVTRGGVAGARFASLLALVVYLVPFIIFAVQQGTSEMLAAKLFSDAWTNVSVGKVGIAELALLVLVAFILLQPALLAWLLATRQWAKYGALLVVSVFTPLVPLIMLYAFVVGGIRALPGGSSGAVGNGGPSIQEQKQRMQDERKSGLL